MRTRIQWVKLCLLSFVLAAVFQITGYSAETIPKISITFTDHYAKGEILEPDVEIPFDAPYAISSFKWNKKVENWVPGEKVTATITLTKTGDDFFQKSYEKSKCTIKGAEFVSAKCDGSPLVVKVRYTPVVILGETERAGWSDNRKSVASWKAVKYANAYEIRLYETDELTRTIKNVTGNYKDLSSYIKNESDYYYEVKAVPKDSEEKKYMQEGEYVVSEMTTIEDVGDTTGRFQTTKDGVKFRNQDGSMAVSTWKYIWGFWYYFNENGIRVTGWNSIGDKMYYMNDNGEMQTGWLSYNGAWYYLASSGEMLTGWVEGKPGMWYYLYSNGQMASNTMIDGTYWVNGDGVWVQ